jgi:hypothetical protein
LGVPLAQLITALGVAALVGTAFDIPALAGRLGQWPPLPPIGAVALICLGASLWSLLQGVRSPAVFAAALALLIGVTALGLLRAPAAFSMVGGVSAASAVLVTTAAVALIIVGHGAGGPEVEQVTLGVAGFILVSLSITIIFARGFGVIEATSAQVIAGASLQTLVSTALLGICFLGLVWQRGFTAAEPPAWLAGAVGIASLITVLFLWRALALREHEQVLIQASQAADAERRVLERDVLGTARTLQRMAEAAAAGSDVEQQRRGMERLRRDLPGLAGGVRLRADGTPLAVVPEQLLDIGPLLPAWTNLMTSRAGFVDSVAYISLDPGQRVFALVAPICSSGRCDGAWIGIMHSAALFATTFSDTSRGFHFGIIGARGRIGGSPVPAGRDSTWLQSVPLQVGDVTWSLSAWPTVSALTRLRSDLPSAVLFMGLLVTALLSAALGLGRSAWRSSREAERARLSLVLERATDSIWEWDLESGSMVRGTNLWRHLRYDPAYMSTELAGWTELIHPEDRAAVERGLREHVAGSTERFEAEYRVRGAGGEWHTIVDRGRVVERHPGGEARRVLGISADVTEARSAAEAREASERRFRAIFDSGFQFQLLLAEDGAVLEVNRAALDHAGVPLDSVRDRLAWDTLWWKDCPAAQARLKDAVMAALAGGSVQYEDDLPMPGADNLLLEVAVKPIVYSGPRATQILMEGRDISERRRAEAALQEVDTLTTMGRVAARVAHEINNPLAGIQNSFLLIKNAVPPTHPHFSYVGAIEREIARIAGVTRQLYETYRPERDETGESSLHMVVGDAVALLEQVNRQTGVRVEVDLSGVPGSVPLPAAMLRQIVNNLVQNAVDASPPGGTVHVTAVANSRGLELRVRDHGPGVPAEIRDRIFEPFFSTKDKRSRTGGMGLGLALVKRTVAAGGGKTAIADPEEGGAEFVVSLPFHEYRNGEAP